MEYHLAMRKNEIIPFAATWMELEGIMLSEISQRRTGIIHFHTLWGISLEIPWVYTNGLTSHKELQSHRMLSPKLV